MAEISPLKRWWTRITHFEFWPFDIFYFPVKLYYLYLALKSRSFFFFTASNPSIDFGGMLGEKKSEIFKLIPEKYKPKTQLFWPDQTEKHILDYCQRENISFPFVLKPDIGERGWMVRKINNEVGLQDYLQEIQVPFLLQEFISYPLELGVFYVEVPGQPGRVTSIVRKGFLAVTGDGRKTVRQLLEKNVRAVLQVDFDDPLFQELFLTVPASGEQVTVEGIGNHCRGTTFYSGNEWIDDQLHDAFRKISAEIDGFHFGRYDLRCESIEHLKMGEKFKILELNGAGSEPGHIYDPGFSLWQAYKDVCWHLSMLQKTSALNKQSGVGYWSFKEGWKKIKEIKAYNRQKQKG